MSTLAGIRTKVFGWVSDSSGKLTNPDDYDRNIQAAIRQYGKHRPNEKIVDVTGNGTHDYALPTGWVDGYSTLRFIEYPVGDVPATLLDQEDYEIYATPTGKLLRLKSVSPASSETFRVTFAIPRADTTIPDQDEDALSCLASAYCLEELANLSAQSSDPTIAADAVNYQSKGAEFASRAKTYRQIYKAHLGLRDEDLVPAAAAVKDLHLRYPGGRERLTHPRWQRRSR